MPPESPEHQISVHLDRLLAEGGMTLTELAARGNITIANLSILRNERAPAIQFSALTGLCDIPECRPGDLPSYVAASDGEFMSALDHPARPTESTGLGAVPSLPGF